MDDGALTAGLIGALLTAGLLLIVAAGTGFDPLPPPVRGKPHNRATQALVRWRLNLRSRRTLLEAALSLIASIAAWVFTGWPIAALGVAGGIVAVPRLVGGRAPQRRIATLEALESWSRQLADVLTTGTGIEDALLATAADPPAAIDYQLTGLRRRLEYRVPTEEALRAWADDIAHPIGDTIAAALITASQVRGRGLHQVLTVLADTVAHDVAMQREVDAERATHRTTALWMLAALGLFTVFAVANKQYVSPFASLEGQAVLAVVVLLYGIVVWWLHRLVTPPPGIRFLPPTGQR